MLAGRVALTPIERILQRALEDAGVDARPQVKFGRYRLDFLIEHDGRQVAVEADGHDFHDAKRDAVRDGELRASGIKEVLRFTGSEIWLDGNACAARVISYLRGSPAPRTHARREALDDGQQQAVAHESGPARVLAPAGAGKTRVLVNRIAALIDRGVDPSSILALAFNKKANEQLVERLVSLGVPTSATKLFDPDHPGVVCANFNAFGYRYQRELLSLRHPVETAPELWRQMMERALRQCGVRLAGAKRGSDPIREFLRALDRVRADLADPDEVEVELDTFDQGPRVVPFAPVYAAYQQLRLDSGRQAFGDQLHVAIVDLLRSPQNRDFVQRRFRHVLVDEYQDLDAAQLALVDIVSRPWRDLFVVGDDDQLIFGWRFANLTNILGFHDRVPPKPYSQTYVLSTNYRSSRAIVESSRRMIAHNQQREPKQIRPVVDAAGGEVRYLCSDSWQQRAEAIVAFLQEQKTPNSRYRDLAVLCRYKAQQPFVALALDSAGIPRTRLLTYRLFSDWNMQLLRAYLQLVRHPATIMGDTMGLLLNRPERYLKYELVAEIAQTTQPWVRFLEVVAQPTCPAGLKDLCARVEELQARFIRTQPTSRELVNAVLFAFHLEQYWRDARQPRALREQHDADASKLLSLVDLHAAQRSDSTAFLEFWDSSAQHENEAAETAPDDLAREVSPKDAVVIGTMHSSKGREYDAIVLYDYDTDLSKLTPEEVEEERRVFYVGLTRARHSALITIDGRKSVLPQFVRESIAPAERNEQGQIKDEYRELRESEGELVIARVRVQERLYRIASGDELTGMEQALDEANATVQSIEADLEQLTPLLAQPTLWEKIRGHAARARREAEGLHIRLEQTRDKRHRLADHATLLANEPGIAATLVEEELDQLTEQLHTLRGQQRELRGRQQQLALIPSGL